MAEQTSVTAFRQAQESFVRDLERVMAHHREALGGEAGVVLTMIEATGAIAANLVQLEPRAAVLVYEQMANLAMYLASSRSTPQ